MEPNELAAAAGRYRDMIYRVARTGAATRRRPRTPHRTPC